jgi:predicted kinase
MSKRAIILSGVSGSGKSTMADKLRAEAGHQAAVCSADYFYETTTGYKFDASKLGEAHAQCLRMWLTYMQEGRPLVICSNTNLTTWEIAPYYQTALALGYEPEIITIHCKPETAADRNLHGLDSKSVIRQHKKLTARWLPPQWKHTVVDA